MAYAANELFTSEDQAGWPRVKATQVMPKTIAAIGAAPELPILTPMAWNTATLKWNVWNVVGANGTGVIGAFTYPDKIQTDAALDVIGQLLLRGEIHRDDIALPTGEIAADLVAALKASKLRSKGIDIQGLAAVGFE